MITSNKYSLGSYLIINVTVVLQHPYRHIPCLNMVLDDGFKFIRVTDIKDVRHFDVSKDVKNESIWRINVLNYTETNFFLF